MGAQGYLSYNTGDSNMNKAIRVLCQKRILRMFLMFKNSTQLKIQLVVLKTFFLHLNFYLSTLLPLFSKAGKESGQSKNLTQNGNTKNLIQPVLMMLK